MPWTKERSSCSREESKSEVDDSRDCGTANADHDGAGEGHAHCFEHDGRRKAAAGAHQGRRKEGYVQRQLVRPPRNQLPYKSHPSDHRSAIMLVLMLDHTLSDLDSTTERLLLGFLLTACTIGKSDLIVVFFFK